MPVLHLNENNSAGQATNLGLGGEDIRIYRITVGVPTVSQSLYIFDENSALVGNTNLVLKYTYPASFSAGVPATQDFSFGPNGMPLGNGGSVMTDAAMDVTVVWDRAENPQLGV